MKTFDKKRDLKIFTLYEHLEKHNFIVVDEKLRNDLNFLRGQLKHFFDLRFGISSKLFNPITPV